MAQNREKDETLDLKVPSEAPLSLSCPDNCKKIPSPLPPSRSDLARFDPGSSDPARPRPAQPQQEQGGGQTERQEKDGEEKWVETASLKRAVNRCSGCGKRVGLVGFRCRCGDLFCGEHRYSDRHDCGYDYKSAGREAIARDNPVVRAAKILKV